MPEQDRPRTLVELVSAQARRHGDRVAVLDGADALTYAALAESADRVAAELVRRGVRPGHRVLLSGPNTVSWVVAAFGVLRAGATLVPCNHRLTGTERRRVAEVVGPRLLLADPLAWPGSTMPALAPEELVRVARACGGRHLDLLDAGDHVGPGTTALVMSTSGTTGAAKFVPMEHGPLVDLYSALVPRVGIGPGDVVLGVAPLAHGFGLFGVLLDSLLTGATARLVPHYRRDEIVDLMVADRVTALFAPYTVFHDLLAGGLAAREHRARIGLTGGADVSLAGFRGICSALGLSRVCVGYGLTEAYGTIAFADVTGASGEAPPLTTMPGLEIRVVGPLGDTVPDAGEGEVWVRGPSVMRGYLAAEDRGVDPDGWLHTGDLGRLDPGGGLRVLSRIKDVVIVNGFNVVPAEVEDVLQDHPGVANAAVVGVPDPRSGEQLVAWVVPSDRHGLDEGALLDHCRQRLAGYKVPTRVLSMEQLPTSATGKRARQSLRDEAVRRIGG